MSSSCNCRGIEVLSDDSGSQRRYELGPVFESWRAGSVSVEKAFRPSRELFPVWMDKCCTEEAMQVDFEPYFHAHIAVAAVITVLCLAALGYTWWHRTHAAISSRTTKNLLADGLLALWVLWSVVSLIGSGPTGSRGYLLFAYFVLLPSSMASYIATNARLVFVYRWNKEKLKCDTTSDECDLSKIEWFLSHKWLIAENTLWMFRGLVLVVGVILTAVTVSTSTSNVNGDSLYSSVRCQWWKIPQQFVDATPSDPICACSDFRFSRSGDDFGMCKVSLDNYCTVAGPTDETNLCTSCWQEFEDVDDSKASSDSFTISNRCKDALANIYSIATCPYVSEAPYYQSCRYGIAADRLARLAATVAVVLLLVIVLVINLLVMPVRDKHGARDEFVTWSCLFVPLLLAAVVGIQPNAAYRAYSADLDGYHLSYLFVFVAVLWTCVCTILYPAVLVALRPEVEEDRATTVVPKTFELDRENLVVCLQTEFLRNLYLDFAAREFTAENVKFLIDMVDFSNSIDDMPPKKVSREAIRIYSMYIAVDSPLQVNISARTREGVVAFIERKDTSSGEKSSGGATFEDRMEVLQWFKPAVQTIMNLVVTDSWPRFKQSKVYKQEFLLLLESNRSIEEAAGTSTLDFSERRSSTLRVSQRLHELALLSHGTTEPEADPST